MQANKKFAFKVEGNWLENKNLPEWIRQRGNRNVGAGAAEYEDAQVRTMRINLALLTKAVLSLCFLYR